MGREQFVIDTFVNLADTLAGDYDISDFLHGLVEHCQEALSVDAGSVMLEDADGTLRLAAATSDKLHRLEDAEIRNDEGACIEAYCNVKQIVAEDLNQQHDRWPKTVPKALDIGLQAVYAFPLRLRDDCIGALNLYRERTGVFDDDDIRLAQAFADVATIGILQQRAVDIAEQRAEQLQHALTSRILIEQAKGVVMAKGGVSSQEAFDLLRTHARNNRVKLHDVAKGVVETQSAAELSSHS